MFPTKTGNKERSFLPISPIQHHTRSSSQFNKAEKKSTYGLKGRNKLVKNYIKCLTFDSTYKLPFQPATVS